MTNDYNINTTIETAPEQKGKLRDLIKDKSIMKNLLILIVLWTSTSFCYYEMNFLLKYYEGDIYINTIVSSIIQPLTNYRLLK